MLEGKTVLLTGACGILGQAMMQRFLSEGAIVIAADLPAAIASLEADEKFGEIDFRAINLSDLDDVERFCTSLLQESGVPDCLVNNAASKGSSIAEFMTGPQDISPKTWREVSSVNVDGAFFLTRRLGAVMSELNSPSIVFIGSIYGELGPDARIYEGSAYLGQEIMTPPVYSATKAAISGLSRYFATVWGPSGVRVNCICPGGVSSGQNDVFEAHYSNRIPLGRMALAEEIAGPVAFMLSDSASYITGQTLMIDGGLSAW